MKAKRDQKKRKPDNSNPAETVASRTSPAELGRTVRFEFSAPEAREVFIAGSFDDWKNTGLPMVRLDDGMWVKELILKPGTYDYLFVVDGAWKPDPSALASVPNPYGGINSCLTVT